MIACAEQQVSIIRQNNKRQLFSFLRQSSQVEVRLSDIETFTYGLIFLLPFGYIIFNLWHTSAMGNMAPDMIFILITDSWEYTEAAIMMPVSLQSLTRLNEITHRINAIKPPVNAYD
nr:ABC transporter six-transmembrane domain-containing protein [Oceanospirillum sediminis]